MRATMAAVETHYFMAHALNIAQKLHSEANNFSTLCSELDKDCIMVCDIRKISFVHVRIIITVIGVQGKNPLPGLLKGPYSGASSFNNSCACSINILRFGQYTRAPVSSLIKYPS